MPGWLKLLLALFAGFILVVVVIGVVVYKKVSSHAPEIRAAAEQMKREGAAYGAGKQPADCIDEALRRADRSFTGQVKTRLFADACFEASTRPPGYCEQIPDGIVATATWANKECVRRNLGGDQACVQVHNALSEYCHPRR